MSVTCCRIWWAASSTSIRGVAGSCSIRITETFWRARSVNAVAAPFSASTTCRIDGWRSTRCPARPMTYRASDSDQLADPLSQQGGRHPQDDADDEVGDGPAQLALLAEPLGFQHPGGKRGVGA